MGKQLVRSSVDPVKVFDAVTLAATRTSGALAIAGYTDVTFHFVYTWAAATELQWYVEESFDGGTTWLRVQATESAVVLSVFQNTYYPRLDQKAVSASGNWPSTWAVNYHHIRLVVTSTAGGATDLLTVTLERHVK